MLPVNQRIIESQEGKTLRGCVEFAVFAYFPTDEKWAVYTRHTDRGDLVTNLQTFADRKEASKAFAARKRECLRS